MNNRVRPVLHLLSYPGQGPHPKGGSPSLDGGHTISGQEVPHLWTGGTTSLDRGNPIFGWRVLNPWMGVPHSWTGYPHPDLAGVPSCSDLARLSPPSMPGWGTPSRLGWGTPRKGPRTSHWVLPGRDLGLVAGVPCRKDMGPVEVLWDGHGVPQGGNRLKT